MTSLMNVVHSVSIKTDDEKNYCRAIVSRGHAILGKWSATPCERG